MERGVAFIRGIGMFGNRNYTREEIAECLEGIGINIVGLYGNDNIVFEKEGMHYASAGKLIERCLEKRFKEKFYVTTRSMGTVTGIVNRFSNRMP